jgi:hypothetical protein
VLSREVAPRPGETGHEARFDEIRRERHDDRDGHRGMLGRPRSERRVRDHDVRLQGDQLGGKGGEPLPMPVGEAVRQATGLSLHVAEVPQALPEGIDGPTGGKLRAAAAFTARFQG